MNKTSHNNVRTSDNSLYTEETVFLDVETDRLFNSFDNISFPFNLGQIIAHEVFGHLFANLMESIFGVSGWNDEVYAINSENLFQFIMDLPQRASWDLTPTIREKRFIFNRKRR